MWVFIRSDNSMTQKIFSNLSFQTIWNFASVIRRIKDSNQFDHLCEFDQIFTARKRSLRRLCFYTCLSFCPQGEGVVSQHALQQVSRGGIPACLAGFQAHTQGGACWNLVLQPSHEEAVKSESSFSQLIQSWQKWQCWYQRIYLFINGIKLLVNSVPFYFRLTRAKYCHDKLKLPVKWIPSQTFPILIHLL